MTSRFETAAAAAASASAASTPVTGALGSGAITGLVAAMAHSATLAWLSFGLSVLGLVGVWYFNRANYLLQQRKMQLEEDAARMRRLEHEARMAAFAARQIDATGPTSPMPLA